MITGSLLLKKVLGVVLNPDCKKLTASDRPD